ncbi:hypothetical protein D3C83_211770 [compost metagenome]
MLAVVQGDPSPELTEPFTHENVLTVAPGICLLGLVLLLGVYIPPPLEELLRAAASSLESR